MAQGLIAAEGHVCMLSQKSHSRSHHSHLQAKSMLRGDLDISAKQTSLQRAGLARCGARPAKPREVCRVLTSLMPEFAVLRMPSFDSPVRETLHIKFDSVRSSDGRQRNHITCITM